MLLYLFYAFIAIVLLNCGYFIFFGKFLFAKLTAESSRSFPVSVIIYVKDKAESLKKNLPFILEQDYPHFEVVLINDSSGDEAQEIMEAFRDQDSRISLVNVVNNERFWGNKKYALTLGIKAAKNPHLLFTETDCIPMSKQWVAKMANGFTSQKSIVLGYRGYKKVNNSFLNKLVRFENILASLQYSSYANIGKAYRGVGQNMGYTIDEFYKKNGFSSHMHIRSGEDVLFVNERANVVNTAVVIDKDSFVKSEPQLTLKGWLMQKRHLASITKRYKKSQKASLAIFYVSQVLFWLLSILLLSFQFYWPLVLGLIGFRLVFCYSIYYKATRVFAEKDLFWWLPFEEIILICLQFVIFITNSVSKPTYSQ